VRSPEPGCGARSQQTTDVDPYDDDELVRTSDSRRLRTQLVIDLERRRLIRSARVGEAFLAVPRELFVPEFAAREGLAAVYRDEAILTKARAGRPLSSSSQPAMMAPMLEQLDIEQGMHVLEIGAGTGYNAALLSLLVGTSGRVVSVEVDPEIASDARRALHEGGYEVDVVHGDGRLGFALEAPYDRIIVTASTDALAPAWHEQLRAGGLLEVPLRVAPIGPQEISVFRKEPTGFRAIWTTHGRFMPLRAPTGEDI
jgi:protein-L-isoaspartate(D-aspartate) O-methyltransferase